VDKQLLGLAVHAQSDSVLAVSFNSDINSWQQEKISTQRGHQAPITQLVVLENGCLVSGDNEGRILLWNSQSGEAERPESLFKHKIQVVGLTSNSKFVYSGSADQHMMQYAISAAENASVGHPGLTLTPAKEAFVKKESSVH
jgi:WD40 repeat protein